MILEALMRRVEEYTEEYEFSFQFWGVGSMNVFIEKRGVEIKSFGGRDTIVEIVTDALDWLDKVNGKQNQHIEYCDVCDGCGWHEMGESLKNHCE